MGVMTDFAERLAEEHADLYRFALSLTRDPDLAGDLVQDTIVRAIEKADQYRGSAHLGAWLRRILHNLAVDRGRRAAKEILVEEVEEQWRDDDYTVDPAVVAERTASREELEDALVRIPFIYRTALILHDVEGWTSSQIADVQGIGLSAAKQRLRRGRMALVSALAEGQKRRKQLEGVPMRCWDARQHVSEYLDGVLDERTAHLVEAHLEMCPTCPPLYASLVEAHTQLSSLRDPDSVVPPEVVQRIQTVLEAEAGPA